MKRYPTSPSFQSALPAGAGARGFTIVEIVVTFLIIAILTAILVPTVARRSEDAKIAAAQSEISRLVDAEERVSTDIGPVVRLYVLNDVPGGDGILNVRGGFPNLLLPTATGNVVNGLADEHLSGFYSNPENLFISSTTEKFLETPQQEAIFNHLITRPPDHPISF